jgi:hypothetical protein
MINGFRALGNTEIINELKNSNLVAECPHCSEVFELSKAILFDGMGKFPDIAEQKRKQLLDELNERIEELKNRKISVAGAEKKAVEVGVGKIIEKVLPAYRDFKLPLSDCRPDGIRSHRRYEYGRRGQARRDRGLLRLVLLLKV